MTDYLVEYGIRIPPARRVAGGGRKFPFNDMDVLGSFLVRDPEEWARARIAASDYARRHKVKFLTRTGAKGLRIWRTR